MDGGRAAPDTAAARIAALPDATRRELELHFLVLGGLRYDAATLIAALGRPSLIPLEQLRESSIYQLILQEGEAKGIERGLEQGLERGLEHEREMIARLVRRKFGAPPDALVARVRALPRKRIESLVEALFDLADLTDLAAWLDRAE